MFCLFLGFTKSNKVLMEKKVHYVKDIFMYNLRYRWIYLEFLNILVVVSKINLHMKANSIHIKEVWGLWLWLKDLNFPSLQIICILNLYGRWQQVGRYIKHIGHVLSIYLINKWLDLFGCLKNSIELHIHLCQIFTVFTFASTYMLMDEVHYNLYLHVSIIFNI